MIRDLIVYWFDLFPEEAEDEVDAYELLSAVDILSLLPKDFYDKLVRFFLQQDSVRIF